MKAKRLNLRLCKTGASRRRKISKFLDKTFAQLPAARCQPNDRRALVRQLFVCQRTRRFGVDVRIAVDVVVGVTGHCTTGVIDPSGTIPRNR
jgi:hypothetical protein